MERFSGLSDTPSCSSSAQEPSESQASDVASQTPIKEAKSTSSQLSASKLFQEFMYFINSTVRLLNSFKKQKTMFVLAYTL